MPLERANIENLHATQRAVESHAAHDKEFVIEAGRGRAAADTKHCGPLYPSAFAYIEYVHQIQHSTALPGPYCDATACHKI